MFGSNIVASMEKNKEIDSTISSQGEATGALTNAFLNVLMETNGNISYHDLIFKVRDRIQAMKSKIGQIPQLSYNQKGLFFVSLNQVKLHHTV
jgi:hypothetical protein